MDVEGLAVVVVVGQEALPSSWVSWSAVVGVVSERVSS